MTEDFDRFLAEYRELMRSKTDVADLERSVTLLLLRAVDALSEDDYDRLGKEFEADAMKAEVAQDAFEYSYEQITKYKVNTVGELPPEVRDEVFRRIQMAEALGNPGLRVVHDDDGSIDIIVRMPEGADSDEL